MARPMLAEETGDLWKWFSETISKRCLSKQCDCGWMCCWIVSQILNDTQTADAKVWEQTVQGKWVFQQRNLQNISPTSF